MSARAARGYRAVHGAGLLEGASPHALTAMLFDAAVARLAAARAEPAGDADAARRADVRRRAIDGALAVVHELQGSLRDPGTDPLSANLHALYARVSLLLVEANRDAGGGAAGLEEAESILAPLREAWRAIAPGAPGGTRAVAA